MLFKTYRVRQLTEQFHELSDIEKVIARHVIICLIEDEKQLAISHEDFEIDVDDTVYPYQALEAMETLNARLSYIFRYSVDVYDTDTWSLTATMVSTVYDHLCDEI